MANETEIWQDFDPSLDIPVGLKNTQVVAKPDVQVIDTDGTEYDIQDGDPDSFDTSENEDVDDVLAAPGSYVLISQTIRTAPDGTQVVDVIIDVEEIPGALDYEVRVSPVSAG